MEFKGPCVYALGTHEMSSAGYTSGVVFNTEMLMKAKLKMAAGIKRVITIENKANYYMQPYRNDTLYLYVHGFMSPAEIRFWGMLPTLIPDAEYLHWGDLDYGGIKIYLMIQDRLFPSLHPLHMGVEDYERYVRTSVGIPLTERSVSLLESVDARELTPLKDYLLAYKLGYEQENMLI